MPIWNELFEQEKNRWRDVYPLVMEMPARFGLKAGSQVLDLGCGAGRHMVYLAGLGYKAIGMDNAPTGLRYTAAWLEQEHLTGALAQADMTALPYVGESYDAVVSIHVIYHNPLASVRRTLSEIHRVLKPGGWALLTFQSVRSYRCGKGEKIETNTYVPDTGEDRGVPHHYFDFPELAAVLNDFSVWKIELEEQVHESGARSSHWDVCVQKPA